MKTFTESNSLPITIAKFKSVKLNNYLIRPLRAGLLGFTTIIMIIFFINLISYITAASDNFGMDYLDLLLAGVGFFLQLTETFLKSFVR